MAEAVSITAELLAANVIQLQCNRALVKPVMKGILAAEIKHKI
jgi:hypothetical protein